MINWQSKPSMLFRKVLVKVFERTLDEIEESLILFGPDGNNTFFDDEIVKMYGGLEKIRDHILMLQKISTSKNIYQITDYSFLLLDRMLHDYCGCYGDMVSEDEDSYYSIRNRGKLVEELDADEFIDLYFFDTDYDLDPQCYNRLDAETKRQMNFSEEIFGVVNRMMPHPQEIEPWEVDTDNDKRQDDV